MDIGVLHLPRASGHVLPATRRIAEEIHNLGHRPVLINYRRVGIDMTGDMLRLHEIDKDGVIGEVLQPDVVICRIGRYHEAGAQVVRAFEFSGTPVTAPASAILTSKDKIATKLALHHHSLASPRSYALPGRLPGQIKPLLTRVEPLAKQPLIVKKSLGSHGRGVMLADTRKSAASVVEGMGEEPLLIEEFIEPTPGEFHSDKRLFVVGKHVVAAMRRTARSSEEDDEFRANLSLGGMGEKYLPSEDEVGGALRAAACIGLAIAGVDTMTSSRGELYIEVNDNPELGIEQISGINIARLMVAHAVWLAENTHHPLS
ncbi:hypothetical protein IPM09_02025 [Candidatus Saccharibacteria bacterium]|nr:MAG: hypothetical protein IPM09_02025 [Candidatus Saccharibacteria bacterium]